MAEADVVFTPTAVSDRVDEAWKVAKLKRITLHECRHTFASLMIAAPKPSRPSWGKRTYGHLMPGTEAEAAQLLGSYLAAQREVAEDTARAADARWLAPNP